MVPPRATCHCGDLPSSPAQLCPVPPGAFWGIFFFLPPCFVPIAKSQELLFPQSLSWALGYNSSLAVHSLAGGEDRVLLYVCSHTAVIHDILGGQQYHLQVWYTAPSSPLIPSTFPCPSSWCLHMAGAATWALRACRLLWGHL